MNKPENFILTTDYATLKNDSGVTKLKITINNNDTVPSGNPGIRTYQDIVSVGTKGAPIRARMRHLNQSSDWSVCSNLMTYVRVDYPSVPTFELGIGAIVERINPTQIRLYVQMTNFNPSSAMRLRRTEVIECELTTFLSPFQS